MHQTAKYFELVSWFVPLSTLIMEQIYEQRSFLEPILRIAAIHLQTENFIKAVKAY